MEKEKVSLSLDQLVEQLLNDLSQFSNGYETSCKELIDKYFPNGGFFKINPNEVYRRLLAFSRERDILLDFSSEYGKNAVPYKQRFTVWEKTEYADYDDFVELCETYDSLFNDLSFSDNDFEEKKKHILLIWKRKCSHFKKISKKPKNQGKQRKVTHFSQLDTSPFDAPLPEKLEKKNINIIPIGSSSKGNSMYIELDKHKILVDAGIPLKKVSAALQRNNRSINDINAIFITHSHSDHISSIKAISNALKCPIFTNEYTQNDLKALGIDSVKIKTYSRTEVMEGLWVTMFKVTHDCNCTCGFSFESGGNKIGYITDSAGFLNEKRISQLFGSDVVVLEANYDLDLLYKQSYEGLSLRVSMCHTSNIKCGYNILELYKHGTRNFILAHLSKTNNNPELAIKTIKTMLRSNWANIYACLPESTELLEY